MGKHTGRYSNDRLEAGNGERDKLQDWVYVSVRMCVHTHKLYTNPNLAAGSKADEGFFYNRDRGPIRSKVLNPFIRRAMMHEPLPSERIKGALRVRWREGGTCDCSAGWDEPASAPIKINPVSLL